MQFRDLNKQYEVLKKEMDQAIGEVLQSGQFIMGEPVRRLEEDLAAYVGVRHCVSCANGTDALSLAMAAWGVGQGDAVFVPDFTFFASGEIVSACEATPVFVDVCEDTFTMDPGHLAERIEQVRREGRLHPRAVVAVDLFGQPANMPEIKSICAEYGLLLLEDGAQGFGGRIGDQRACSFGDIGTTSFFPAKPLGCYGDGGAVFTDNDAWADLLRSFRVHGKGKMKYDNVRIGRNSRLDTLQAAVLTVKFRAFRDYELERVNEVAALYGQALEDLDDRIRLPEVPENFYSSWAQYTIILPTEEWRDGLKAHLQAKDIPANIYYPKPMHEQKAFASLEDEEQFPVSERLCRTVLSLPMHPYLTEEDIYLVKEAIGSYAKDR